MNAHRKYYQACRGSWRSDVDLTVSDPGRLKEVVGWLDALSIRFLAAWPRWLGRMRMYTTVEVADGGPVVHTTTVKWFFVPLLRSVENIDLTEDGRSFEMWGTGRMAPALWRHYEITGSGEIDDSSREGSYQLTWFGIPIAQTTRLDGDLVTVRMTSSAGFEGVQQLRRYAPS